LEPSPIYAQLDATGLHYGPWFRGLRQIRRGENAVLVQVGAHEAWRSEDDAHRLHPTLLDTCFQALMITMKPEDGLYLPVGIERLRFYATPEKLFWCFIQVTDHNARFIECDLTLCDEEGRVYAELEKLRCKAVPRGQNDEENSLDAWLYRLSWEPTARPTAATARDETGLPIVILERQGEHGEKLAHQLTEAGAARVVRLDTPLPALAEALTALGPCRAVIGLWGVESISSPEEDPVGMACVIDTLGLVQTLVRNGADGSPASAPRLYLVTRGAQPVREGAALTGLRTAPLIGLARVAASEQPGLRCTVLDLDSVASDAAWQEVAREVLADLPESEVAWRDGERVVNRLVRENAATLSQKQIGQNDDHGERPPFVLELARPGALSSLQLRACERRPPGPGEVEIEVHAAGIGMRDLIRLTQKDPEGAQGKTFFGDGIGMEVSGIVTRVGPGVQTLTRNQAILAILPGGFRSHITLPVNAIWTLPRPDRIGDAECGGLPMAFLAAYFGLYRAYLGAGERVLIHGAHGDMGLAAIQVAQWRGAEIFVTADTPEKRKYLRSLGLRHVFDSRFPTYVEQIMTTTEERGVDVIFNTLGGEAGQKSVLALAPFGRFVELGEYVARKETSWNLAGVERNISFMSVDLDHLARRREIMPVLLEEISEQFRNGTFKPIHTHVFPADRAAEAFEQVQNGQLGKAVLDMRGTAPLTILPQRKEPPLFRGDGTYLITGGFGSFGLKLAAWMGGQGVRQLVLTGRQGA
ncbi:MAG: polyketide synthase dehydratase domain-containing protein, partial [Magnetococcales bacterium]|nr:polyketide synthase dehydratase domain-containing protein [Magnetococcales bacterium]